MSNKDREGFSPRAFVTKKVLIASLLIVALTIYGCAGVRESMAKNQALATAICAAGGATAGGLLGNRWYWALIGGVTAATVCFTIAEFSSTPSKDYQQTQTATHYKGGTVVHVDSFKVDPNSVSPGQKLTFTGEYSVMTPDRNADLPVVERVIYSYYNETEKQWKEVGRTENAITIKPGTRRITPAEVIAPKEPPAPQVQFALQVEHNNVSDQKNQGVFMAIAQAPASMGVSLAAFEVVNDEVRVASRR